MTKIPDFSDKKLISWVGKDFLSLPPPPKGATAYPTLDDGSITSYSTSTHAPAPAPEGFIDGYKHKPLPTDDNYGAYIMKKLKSGATMLMYCVKCRTKQNTDEAEEVRLKNGKPAWKAPCPICRTGMFKIGSV